MNKPETGFRFIGQPMPRTEDARLLIGAGRFTDDFDFPGQTYAAMVRSPHPHARIVSIDKSRALALPGVLGVFTGAICAGKDAEHAGQRQRAALVDRDDARMRMRRANHRRVSLPGKIEIVGKAARADEQPRVFGARHGLPDEAKAGFRFIHDPTPRELPLFSPRPWT